MNKRTDVLLQYLRSEVPGFNASNETHNGSVDYSFCVPRPGDIFWLRVRSPFSDSHSAEVLGEEIRRIDLAAEVRRLGAALVTATGMIESLAI